MLQIILLHILGQVINLHLKTKTSAHSEWPVLQANTWVGVVKAYDITTGTQPKSQLSRGASTRQAPNTAVPPERLTLPDRQALLLPVQQNTPAWEHQGLSHPSLEAYQVQRTFLLLHVYDVLSSIPRRRSHPIHAILQEQRLEGGEGSPNWLWAYWCVNTSSPEVSAAALRQKHTQFPRPRSFPL